MFLTAKPRISRLMARAAFFRIDGPTGATKEKQFEGAAFQPVENAFNADLIAFTGACCFGSINTPSSPFAAQ